MDTEPGCEEWPGWVGFALATCSQGDEGERRGENFSAINDALWGPLLVAASKSLLDTNQRLVISGTGDVGSRRAETSYIA
jgi:hypothetical protein